MYIEPHTGRSGQASVPQLHRTPLGEADQFALFGSATRRDAAADAELAAAFRGFPGAFSDRTLLQRLPPVRGLPTVLGGLPKTPLPPALERASRSGGAQATPKPRPSYATDRRSFWALIPSSVP